MTWKFCFRYRLRLSTRNWPTSSGHWTGLALSANLLSRLRNKVYHKDLYGVMKWPHLSGHGQGKLGLREHPTLHETGQEGRRQYGIELLPPLMMFYVTISKICLQTSYNCHRELSPLSFSDYRNGLPVITLNTASWDCWRGIYVWIDIISSDLSWRFKHTVLSCTTYVAELKLSCHSEWNVEEHDRTIWAVSMLRRCMYTSV